MQGECRRVAASAVCRGLPDYCYLTLCALESLSCPCPCVPSGSTSFFSCFLFSLPPLSSLDSRVGPGVTLSIHILITSPRPRSLLGVSSGLRCAFSRERATERQRARDGGDGTGPTRRAVAVERSPCCCCSCSALARCMVSFWSNASGAHQLWETTWEAASWLPTMCAMNVDKTFCPSPTVDSAIAMAGLPSSCAGPRGAQKWSHGKSSTLS